MAGDSSGNWVSAAEIIVKVVVVGVISAVPLETTSIGHLAEDSVS